MSAAKIVPMEAKTGLPISDKLSLPLSVVTEKLAFLGRTGSGKTYGATKLAELLLGSGAQIVAIDPVGVWAGLRMGGSFNVYLFGGLHGDFPLESTAGVLMADVLVDRGISAVLDVSQFGTHAELQRFATDFAQRFFQRKKASPSAVHVFLEECQEFVPQNPMPGEQRMLHEFERLWKLGRNFGVGGSLISQRPQEVNKKVLNQAGTLFVFQMTGPQERKAIEGWVADKGISENIMSVLPKLRVGEPHLWSPMFLQVSETIRIAKKVTADISSTPDASGRSREQPLTTVDLEAIKAKMAETIERAKGDDPRELRRRIAALERELADARTATPPPTIQQVSVIQDEDRALVRACTADILAALVTVRESLAGATQTLDQVFVETGPLKRVADAICSHDQGSLRATAHVSATAKPATRRALSTVAERVSHTVAAAPGGLDGAQQRILDTASLLEDRGLEPNRVMLARWMGIHPNGRRYGTNLAALRASGLLDGCRLTDAGRRLARTQDPGGLAGVRAAVDGATCAMVDALAQHGRPVTREELAGLLGIHPNGGRYGTNLALLRAMGVIPERGSIYLTEAAGA